MLGRRGDLIYIYLGSAVCRRGDLIYIVLDSDAG
jgi:hypothetical protein